MPARSALNGYYERVRRLLRLVGVSDVPEGICPVVIVGDSREPGTAVSSYRRFGFTLFATAGPVATDSCVKVQALADLVIEKVRTSHQSTATAANELRVLTAAEVTADVAATWTVPAASTAAWTDTPSAGPPPVIYAQNGTVGANVGRAFYGTPFNSGEWEYSEGLFLPRGSALYFRAPTNGVTNWRVSLAGYTSA